MGALSLGALSLRSSCLATLASVSMERGTFGSHSSAQVRRAAGGANNGGRTPRRASSHLFPRLGEESSPGESGRRRAQSTLVERSAPGWLRLQNGQSNEDLLDFESNSPQPLTCIADAHEGLPTGQGASLYADRATKGPPTARSDTNSSMLGLEAVAAHDIDEDRLAEIVDLHQLFPFDEVDYNRCALQLSSETSLDEIHSLFSFMSMGHVWITAGGTLCGVVSDRLLIEACLPVATAAEA